MENKERDYPVMVVEKKAMVVDIKIPVKDLTLVYSNQLIKKKLYVLGIPSILN
jgi:hypothetical protein